MNPSQIVDNSVVSLVNTATLFGQGQIASAISGNPFYSQDPAAANYATATGMAPTSAGAGLGNIGGILILAVAAFFFFKGK